MSDSNSLSKQSSVIRTNKIYIYTTHTPVTTPWLSLHLPSIFSFTFQSVFSQFLKRSLSLHLVQDRFVINSFPRILSKIKKLKVSEA